MKFIKIVSAIFIVLIILFNMGNSSDSDSKAGQSHTLIQRLLKEEALKTAKFPETVVMGEYKFTALAGAFGMATYTYTANNSFNVPVKLMVKVTVEMNEDLTVKEYKDLLVIKL
jgi:hypothetical protein